MTGARRPLADDMPGHALRIFRTDHDRDLWSWRCACGMSGDRDILCADYARDDAREAHGLDPLIGYPLI